MERYIGFWNAKEKYGFLSNFYECRVIVIDHIFKSAEQAFHYYKAVLFKDEETAEKILQSNTPKEAKALGRKVKNFDKKMWDENKIIICKMVLRGKFNYNDDLKNKLLDTGDAILVECSPYDRIWGIGYSNRDPEFQSKQTDLWGQNLLGKCLMDIRKEIIHNNFMNNLFKENNLDDVKQPVIHATDRCYTEEFKHIEEPLKIKIPEWYKEND